ncbi:MAG: hypothetical protein L0332_17740 [Chloroflexi bacterium]|nr:hypothetical protein [Chloroflexota bacterium]
MVQAIQRTLIITHGPVAAQAGRRFQEWLAGRRGPEAAVAVLRTEPGDGSNRPAPAALQAALSDISAVTLASQLEQQGYALDDLPEIALVFVLDTALDGAEMAGQLAQAVTATVYHYLGLETAALLIWLTNEPASEATAACLAGSEEQRRYFSRGVLALSPLNEAGLRLPDEEALAESCAEVLWALVTTSLRATLEWLTFPDGDPFLASAGAACWAWWPESVQQALCQRWLLAVLDQWLTPAAEGQAAGSTRWIEEHRLLPHQLQEQTLSAEELLLSPFLDESVWQAPWPWELPALFSSLLTADVGDAEIQAQREEWADFRLGEALCSAYEEMKDALQRLLNEKPVGGLAQAQAWTEALAQEFDRLRDTLMERAAERERGKAILAGQQAELEKRLQPLLAAWPASPVAWLGPVFRPWRWPRLAWRYVQLRGLGRQLVRLCQQQAARRRQQAMAKALIHATDELEKLARRCYSQVEEIGEMLGYLKKVISAWTLEVGAEPGGQPLIARLYGQLVADPQIEAEAAAAAIGGLGQQLIALDDAILAPLQQVAMEQLAGLDGLLAVDILHLLYPTPGELAAWWRACWEQAAPLWRHDPARLPERARAQEAAFTAVSGAAVNRLAPLLPETARSLESGDRERIVVLRLRGGLTVPAMTFQMAPADNTSPCHSEAASAEESRSSGS